MEEKQNKKIGQYLITRQLLGRGSFSTVYKAYDSHHQPLAAKVIPLPRLTCTPPLKQNHKPPSNGKSAVCASAATRISSSLWTS